MVTNSSNKQADSAKFSLKHRLIGAGILISFGVLILPWLLGSYSVENDQALNDDISREAKPSSIASLVSKAGNQTVGEQESDNKSGSEEAGKAGDKPEVKVFKSRVQPIEPVAKDNKPEPKKKVTTVKPKPTEDDKSKQKVAKKVDSTPTKKPEKSPTTQKKIESSKQKKTEPSKPKSSEVNRGYIVSVGVFGDAKNVEKMVADLKSKQFAPEVRKETLKSKSVSRIYMGPYSTRAEAVKVKLRLTDKGINKTLIKAFP